jgi:hypothetical protein
MNHYFVTPAPISNDQLLASLRREADASLRLAPERLPWRGTEDLPSRHERPHTPPRDRLPARRHVAGHELDAQDERVARVLASSGPMLRRDIEDRLNLPYRDVMRSLTHLQRAGRVAYDGMAQPRWRLLDYT